MFEVVTTNGHLNRFAYGREEMTGLGDVRCGVKPLVARPATTRKVERVEGPRLKRRAWLCRSSKWVVRRTKAADRCAPNRPAPLVNPLRLISTRVAAPRRAF